MKNIKRNVKYEGKLIGIEYTDETSRKIATSRIKMK